VSTTTARSGPLEPSENNATVPQFSGRIEVPRLEIHVEREGGQAVERVTTLDGEVLRVGSHPTNDIALADPMVSRFHCRIQRSRTWTLTDSGSLNGTRLAGVSVRDADLVLPECVIELGASRLRVREAAPASAAAIAGAPSFGGLFGASPPMRRLFDLLRRVAKADANVLIEGESGTGKELIAAEIVRRGARASRPFVVVDCGAMARSLIESELFGHARGAFTGADQARVGAFEAADGGTVFLDEIGELPIDMQPKLLRVLETGEVRRIGENQLRKVDVRVIAATNRNLEREVNHGRFREDLFFRLSVVTLRVPPLRERLDDLPLLVGCFLAALGSSDKSHLFTPELYDEMSRHVWPGNVRELRNFVERTVVLEGSASPSGGDRARPSSPPPPMSIDIERPFREAKDSLIDAFERSYLTALLAWSDGNVSRAARKADIDRMYLHRLLQRHGLRRNAPIGD
jgi:transcriptional regulator with GAF, ATPase, and Fis domain